MIQGKATQWRRPPLWSSAASAALTSSLGSAACAQISTESIVALEPRAQPAASFESIELTDHALSAEAVQLGDTLVVRLTDARTCRTIESSPVTRVETIERTDPQKTAIWEYALAGVVGGLAALAVAKPNLFGSRAYTSSGDPIEDNRAGYTTGTLFGGIAVLSLSAAITDSVRLRDSTIVTDAFQTKEGPERPCPDAIRPVRETAVVFVVDDDETTVTTDGDGRVRVTLPHGDAGAHEAAFRVGDRAVAVSFVRPFETAVEGG